MTIGFSHAAPHIGGPGSFQSRLTSALQNRGYRVVYPKSHVAPDIILVVGGTAKLLWLWLCKFRGARIVHRLDGMNWRHRVLPTRPVYRALSELRNWLTVLVRNYLADHIVYQSEFVRYWWDQRHAQAPCLAESVIYNGVDLSLFAPVQQRDNGCDRLALLCVEGNVHDDPITLKILTTISERLFDDGSISTTLVCGNVPQASQAQLARVKGIRLLGCVPREKIHEVFSRSAVFLVLEINPPCPNSVIEALASGVPVVGFDTGSLRELVPPECGLLVPYGGNPWRLEQPDILALEQAVRQVLARREEYSRAARSFAEQKFGIDNMVDSYLAVFDGVLAA